MLDIIKTKEKVRTGIIDYANKKQVFFYDLTHNNDEGIRILITMWYLYGCEARFSIFAGSHAPEVKLPPMSVVPMSSVLNKEDLEIPDYDYSIKMTKSS